MGLISWLFRWFGWSRTAGGESESRDSSRSSSVATLPGGRVRLRTTRREDWSRRKHRAKTALVEVSGKSPYRYARFGSRTGCYLDLSQDGDDARLASRDLPVFHTPEELANWLEIPLNKLAWLVHRFTAGRPASLEQSHYHCTWRKKRSGGARLIESPKKTLKAVQVKILREILDHVPAHAAAHGFVTGRSIMTNARPHVGQAIVVKFDLKTFYTTVRWSRVVAIFRSLGYSREASIWLGLLTTSALPSNIPLEGDTFALLAPYLRRHLPQGAPTSPALANLSAYHLDCRLTGLARSLGATFTRYADDLTFSGSDDLGHRLRVLIPLVEQIVRRERFQTRRDKRQILRSHQRQAIAGVVVNTRTNVPRADFDRLKATLTNCVRSGPSTQNHGAIDDFAAHLRGRIAHVLQLNPNRGQRLLTIFQKIDWRR